MFTEISPNQQKQGTPIIDSNGNTVEGVEGWGTSPQQCGIRIISAEEVAISAFVLFPMFPPHSETWGQLVREDG